MNLLCELEIGAAVRRQILRKKIISSGLTVSSGSRLPNNRIRRFDYFDERVRLLTLLKR